jgi:hypothetical protein
MDKDAQLGVVIPLGHGVRTDRLRRGLIHETSE